jgi:hypothetical protein
VDVLRFLLRASAILAVISVLSLTLMPMKLAAYNGSAPYQWDSTVPNYNASTVIHSGTIDTSNLVLADFVGISSSQPNADLYGDWGVPTGWDDDPYLGGAFVGDPNTNGDALDGKWVGIGLNRNLQVGDLQGWWDLKSPASRIMVAQSMDHGNLSLPDQLSFRIFGSNTLWSSTLSSQAVLTDVYLDGWRPHNPAEDQNGDGWCSDDVTAVLQLPGNYRYIKVVPWKGTAPITIECEIDAIAGFAQASPGNSSIILKKYVSVDNQVSWVDADSPTGPSTPVGQNVYFKFYLQNTGDVPLSNIALSDSMYDLGGILPSPPTSLAVGGNYTGIIGPIAATAGQHSNTAQVTANGQGYAVQASDSANYLGVCVYGAYFGPANSVADFGQTADVQVWINAPDFESGQILLKYDPACANVMNWVRNTTDFPSGGWDSSTPGEERINFIADSPMSGAHLVGTLTIQGISADCTSAIDFVTSTEVSQSLSVQVAAVPAGAASRAKAPALYAALYAILDPPNCLEPLNSISHCAVFDQNCNEISACCWTDGTFSSHAPVTALALEKYVSVDGMNSWIDADSAPGPSVPVCHDVYFKFFVQNTGNEPLSNLTLTDSVYDLSGLAPPPATLEAGGNYTRVFGPVAAASGSHQDIGKVTGSFQGNSMSATDPAYYLGVAPGTKITITASSCTANKANHCSTQEFSNQGCNVTLTITERNTGNVDLTGPWVDLYYRSTHDILNSTTLGFSEDANQDGKLNLGEIWQWIFTGPWFDLYDAATHETLNSTTLGFSGDANHDGKLNVGETWQWILDKTLSADTTYTAIGHGTDPLNNDITYPQYKGERFELVVTVPGLFSCSNTCGWTIDGWDIRHGFELHCDITQLLDRLEVNWGKGNNFHCTELKSDDCFYDPQISPNSPNCSCNTYVRSGIGQYNAADGARAEWTFTDTGEPGKNDWAHITIYDANGEQVLDVQGNLHSGNQQFHEDEDQSDTPAGSKVTISLPEAIVIFDNVTSSGNTMATASQNDPAGKLPPAFREKGPFTAIKTSATYAGTVAVGIRYDAASTPNPQKLKLLHFENGNWHDVTTSIDTADNLIWGTVSYLSSFVVASGGSVASVSTATGTGIATLSSESAEIDGLAAVAEGYLPADDKPNLEFKHGFFSFELTDLSPGEVTTLTLSLPTSVPAGSQYWKYGPTPTDPTNHWYQIPMASDGMGGITITLVDGGLGDDDLTPNGVIVDQGGPGYPPGNSGGDPTSLPVFPNVYIGIGAALGAGIVAYLLRRRLTVRR